MPLGWQRLNVRQKGPNDAIVFIKPLEGPSKATAQDFLERVAAICVPIMKANHLAVVSLEEYEPNPEFVGRNFNAGEIIQLVLKAPGTKRWLPFTYVCMVMMHELAHCKQMNHSKAFWKVRNQYAEELKGLWEKNYTGEGLWGRGQALYDGQYTEQTMPASDYLFENTCGGTYRSSRRGKRKRKTDNEKPKISYAERKQRRILKKFGTGGTALGNDEDTKIKLEDGKKSKGKPRVAGSARGRELRAAAALARLEQAKEQPIKEEDEETESDYDSDGVDGPEAIDANGEKPTDSKGNRLVKVCEDGDTENDPEARNEMKELSDIRNWAKPLPKSDKSKEIGTSPVTNKALPIDEDDESTASEDKGHEDFQDTLTTSKRTIDTSSPKQNPAGNATNGGNNIAISLDEDDESTASEDDQNTKPVRKLGVLGGKNRPSVSKGSQSLSTSTKCPNSEWKIPPGQTIETIPESTSATSSPRVVSDELICEICSLANDPSAVTCAACSHVLDLKKYPNYWRCKSSTCQGSKYVNSDDTTLCGVCGAKRSSPQ